MLNLMHISRLASFLIDNAYCIADPTISKSKPTLGRKDLLVNKNNRVVAKALKYCWQRPIL